jgi:outer membrane protein
VAGSHSWVGADPIRAKLDLKSSWGLSARAGVDIPINENWSVSASAWWIDIDTEATVSTAVADVKFDVAIDPWVYMLGVAYRF